MFDPMMLHPLPDFSWQAVEETEAIKAYRHFYRLDKILAISGVYHCFGNIKAGDFTLLAQAFIRPDNQKNVFLLHGYTDHLALFDQLILTLVQAGFNVIGLDLPGHGLSISGIRAGIQSFQQYQQAVTPLIQDAQQQLPGSWAIIGQSTGGAIAMDYVLNQKTHGFQHLVLLAPLVVPANWWLVQVQFYALRRVLKRIPRIFRDNSSNRQFMHFLEHCDPLQTRWLSTTWVQALVDWQAHFNANPHSTIATLLIQGGKDVVVDGKYNKRRILQKFSQVESLYLPQAKHHLANETAALQQVIFQRILMFLA